MQDSVRLYVCFTLGSFQNPFQDTASKLCLLPALCDIPQIYRNVNVRFTYVTCTFKSVNVPCATRRVHQGSSNSEKLQIIECGP